MLTTVPLFTFYHHLWLTSPPLALLVAFATVLGLLRLICLILGLLNVFIWKRFFVFSKLGRYLQRGEACWAGTQIFISCFKKKAQILYCFILSFEFNLFSYFYQYIFFEKFTICLLIVNLLFSIQWSQVLREVLEKLLHMLLERKGSILYLSVAQKTLWKKWPIKFVVSFFFLTTHSELLLRTVEFRK